MTSPLWSFVRTYRGAFAGLLGVMVMTSALENLVIVALFPLLTVLLGGGVLSGGVFLETIDRALAALPMDKLAATLAFFLAVVLLNGVAKLAREWAIATVSGGVEQDVKQRLFDKIAFGPPRSVLEQGQADLIYRLSAAPRNLAIAIVLLAHAVNASIAAALTLAILWTIDPRVTGLAFALAAGMLALNRLVAAQRSIRAGSRRQAAATAHLGALGEFILGVKEIVAAQAQGLWAARVRSGADLFRRYHIQDMVWSAVPGTLLEVVVLVTAGIVAVLARVLAGDQFAGLIPLLAVYAYAVRFLLGRLTTLSRTLLQVAGHNADVALLERALREAPPSSRPGWRTEIPDWRAIRFQGVSLRYGDRPTPALSDVSLELRRGTLNAIIGGSGAGKSTLLYLLMRFMDPTEGTIHLNGTRLDEYTTETWLRRVGYVSQDIFIYDASVSENIAFGGGFGPDEVRGAAAAAHADEFIAALPDGYDTRLGDRGSALSAGQRQRIALARALIRTPDVLLLDEITSALDARSESLIYQTLESLRDRCTLVVVTHRVPMIRSADQIVVLGEGRVIARGTHRELADTSVEYARLLPAPSA